MSPNSLPPPIPSRSSSLTSPQPSPRGKDVALKLPNEIHEVNIILEKAPIPPLEQNKSENHERRHKICRELLETEKSYVDSLKHFFENWVPHLRNVLKQLKAEVIEVLNNLFSTIEIIIGVHTQLYESLAPTIEIWRDDKQIGTIFLKMAPYFKTYRNYASIYKDVVDVIEKAKQKSVAFSKALSELTKQSKVPTIGHYLIMPIQRIPRYELLIADLVRCTSSNHPDYSPLCSALQVIKEIAEYINTFSIDSQDRVLELGLSSALAPARRFLKEGVFSIKSKLKEKKLIRLVLFSDLLIRDELSTHHGKSIYPKIAKKPLSSAWCWPLKLCWISDIDDKEDLLSFTITGPDHIYRLVSSDQIQKNEWVESLRQSINQQIDIREGDRRLGKFEFVKGGVYNGWWLNGLIDGQGMFTLYGNKYEGQFKQGFKDGVGSMIYSNGATYNGEWKLNSREGKGSYIDPMGNEYDGNWLENRKHGHGIIKYPDGSFFEGEWKMDLISGFGKLHLKSGMSYEGEWVANNFHGQGTFKKPNGERYVGQWEHGKKLGNGEMWYPDGKIYIGMWKNDMRHGNGKLIFSGSNSSYDGNWVEDKQSGEGIILFKDKSMYTGSWKDGKPHGTGTFVYGDSPVYVKYTGEWVLGKKCGKGELIMAKGVVYKGHFKDDQIYTGKLTFPNGSAIEGRWVNGILDGKCIYHTEKERESLSGSITQRGALEYGENKHYKSAQYYSLGDNLLTFDYSTWETN